MDFAYSNYISWQENRKEDQPIQQYKNQLMMKNERGQKKG